ncbi:MAG TPA: YtxH domain-containing protein [Gemmatimonadales bacterium]|nr:YtxH domain-containing protein [Gemmatimonadales bacterium]
MSRYSDDDREIIYLEREPSSIVGPLLAGLALGLGVGLLFAPQSGAETRRTLRRKIRRLRAYAGDQVDRISEQVQEGVDRFRGADEEDEEEDGAASDAPPVSSARAELERRLAAARARRRRAAADEEPVA